MPGVIGFGKEVFASIKRLPPQIRKVCEIQFCYWVGWFPFLFYMTTYIGQLYVNPFLKPELSDEEVDALWVKATRIGTFALLLFAIVSFLGNTLIPFVITPTYEPTQPDESHASLNPSSPITANGRPRSISSSTYPLGAAELGVNPHASAAPGFLARTLSRLQIPGLTLRRAWLLTQILFALCMFSTAFISTIRAATVMTAVIGISWALAQWAPFALISAEVALRDEQTRRKRRAKLSGGGNDLGDEQPDLENDEEEADQAGVILGLHNVAVSSPQVLATLLSSVIFKFLQKERHQPGDTSVAWTLRMGGVAALLAAFVTNRLRESEVEE